MTKGKSKRGQRRQRARSYTPSRKIGLDLGVRRRVMFLSESDFEFNNALRAADSAGCAYGYQRIQDYVVPAMTLLGTNEDGFRKAFDVFKRWGCEFDGDVVEITVVMRRLGGYFLIIGPNMERFFRRMSPDYQLVEPIALGLQWIKPIDTTNPMLLEMQRYSEGAFSPIAFGASTVRVINGVPTGRPEDVKFIDGLPDIITYNMNFIHEDEQPDHWVLKPSDKEHKRPKGAPGNKRANPNEIAIYRRRAIDQCFPVTRERVKRAKLFEAVHTDAEFSDVTPDQVTQAAINLLLSQELTGGRPHFEGLDSPNEKIWDRIFERYEHADGNDPVPQLTLDDVKEQIRLDVLALLNSEGMPAKGNFRKLQKELVRLGYA